MQAFLLGTHMLKDFLNFTDLLKNKKQSLYFLMKNKYYRRNEIIFEKY